MCLGLGSGDKPVGRGGEGRDWAYRVGWEMGWARVVSQYFQLYEGVCNIVCVEPSGSSQPQMLVRDLRAAGVP